ncbi:MAG: NAD(P)H-quinone oxidoreductase [Chromatiales bacterium]|jgi:putative PIG3 family NAD(P)H quinone oxidoreductase|nr:NAD(P)H-quinone oxidoreductase [Chromatiales bacterium]
MTAETHRQPADALPADMAAVAIARPGGPEVLTPVRRPLPQPGPGEILIRVAAAGVNRPDCLQRAGGYPPPPGVSDLPGLEVAGTVVAAGPGVATPAIGDAVCALVAGGGYAAYCVAPAVQCLPVPAGLDFVTAAAVPETFFTVWHNVFERGQLRAGETLLVHGGASGIGTTAIQLAAALGARVFATAGSDDKCRLCESLGAERGINYRTESFASILKPPAGADVVLDMVGGPYLADNVKALNEDGRLVVIAALGGTKAEINLGLVFVKRLVVTGSTLRNRPVAEKGRMALEIHRHVWPLLASGRVKPVVQQVFPLEQAAEAHRLLEANEARGKLVLKVG